MRSRGQIYIAGLLTWIAGFVDAVGFLALLQIYTANMSGNSVAIGIQLWNQNWMEVVRRAWPVAVYVASLLLGRILLEIAGTLKIRSVATLAFVVEGAALVAATFAHSVPQSQKMSVDEFLLIGLLAFAMGLQNATLTRFSSLTLHTGFVTGTLVKMAEQFTKYLTWSYNELRRPRTSFAGLLHSSGKQENLRTAVVLSCIWLAYVAGAMCGAAGHSAFDLKALYVPIAALALLAIADLYKPIAVRDEQEQANVS